MSTRTPRRFARRTRLFTAVSAAAITASSAVALITAAPAHAADAGSQSFVATGNVGWYTVPANVFRLHVQASGGSGSDGESVSVDFGALNWPGGKGGKGATVDAEVVVTPGERLSVNVGTAGGANPAGYGSAPGGPAGSSSRSCFQTVAGAGHGGGPTFISRADGTPLVVAAGGGGGGSAGSNDYPAGSGGDGGWGGGYPGFSPDGTHSGSAGVGSSGQEAGGRGGDAASCSYSGAGGGGGGGWNPAGTGGGAGGGAGAGGRGGGGGAGGVNYSVDAKATVGVAAATGNGSVVITPVAPLVNPDLNLLASLEPGLVGQPVTFYLQNFVGNTHKVDGTVVFGIYDLATGTEVPMATWQNWVPDPDIPSMWPHWTTTFPAGAIAVYASYSGGGATNLAPFKLTSVHVTQYAPVDKVTLAPLSVDFGAVSVGSAATRTVTVTNAGNVAWSVGSLSLTTPGFTITGGTCGPTPVAPGASCTFAITFAPKATGAAATTLTVTDTAGKPTAIPLSGTGAPAPLVNPAPSVTALSPASGPSLGGSSVTITGSNFTNVTAVRFGAAPATAVRCPSTTTCIATSPAGTKSVDVTVTTAAGTSAATSADRFTYTP